MSIENTKNDKEVDWFFNRCNYNEHHGNNTDVAFCLAQDLNQKLFSQSVAQMHAML